jgi:predicted molibdopterin-dependent oxidoreductase YjgC
VHITVDGEIIQAFDGEVLAVALAAGGYTALRRSPTLEGARGVFCFMGVCQECLVDVDGTVVTACLETVRDGMAVALRHLAQGPRTDEAD